jgi:hypothetical protein
LGSGSITIGVSLIVFELVGEMAKFWGEDLAFLLLGGGYEDFLEFGVLGGDELLVVLMVGVK